MPVDAALISPVSLLLCPHPMMVLGRGTKWAVVDLRVIVSTARTLIG